MYMQSRFVALAALLTLCAPVCIAQDAVLPDPSQYDVPKFEDYYFKIEPVTSFFRYLSGSVKKQQQSIDAYWEGRHKQLDLDNKACLGRGDDTEIRLCLMHVRANESSKNAYAHNYVANVAQAQYEEASAKAAAWSGVAQSFQNQMYLNQMRQMQYHPHTTFCNPIGNSVYCNSY